MRLAFSLLCLLLLTTLTATVTTRDYTVTAPTFERAGEYDRINIDNGIVITRPGFPQIPSVPVRLLLPAGEKAVSVNVRLGAPVELSGTHRIQPIQTPLPIGTPATGFTAPDPLVYASNSFYPAVDAGEPLTQYYRGHAVAYVNVNPIRYLPSEGRVLYYPDFQVEITSEPDPEARQSFDDFYRGDESTVRQLSGHVDNPSVLAGYPAETRDRIEDYRIVFITSETFVPAITDLVEFKIRQGMHPLVVTTQDIYSTYTGTDSQDKIRNFIKYCYQTYNTEYIVLCGDVATVPCRGFYLAAGDTVDEALPSDHYYAGLDRMGMGSGPDWDTNSNGHWGEHTEADYYPEVAVGRLSATNASEFAAIVNKQIMYQQSPVVADLENALMVGEQLNDNPITWGGNYKDQIMTGGTFDNHTTVGISNNFDVDTMYERDGWWSSSELAQALNSGKNLVNHLGHSGTDYNMKFYIDEVTNSRFTANGTNHNFYLIYSQGCYAAAYDDNSIAEQFCKIANGCAVYVGNSRYGWYNPGGTNASSQWFDREFFDAIFGEGITRVSDANNDSKIDGISQCNDEWFRWTFYELNVFGDPSLDLWTATPTAFTATYPAQLVLSDNQFTVQTGVPGALVGISRNGVHIAGMTAGASGSVTVVLDQPIGQVCTLDLVISYHNKLMSQGVIHVVAPDAPYVVMQGCTVEAGNDNVIANGETVTLDITLDNIGTVALANASASISTFSPLVTLTDATETVTGINANGQLQLEGAFSFTVSQQAVNDTTIPFSLAITSQQGIWTQAFDLVVYTPVLSNGPVEYVDGDNGILNPGETTPVRVHIRNTGGAPAENLSIHLSANDPYITLGSSSAQIPLIEGDNDGYFTLDVTCNALAPEGYMASIGLTVTAAHGLQYTGSFVVLVGSLADGFETGGFTAFPWEMTGDANWTTVGTGAFQGARSARSGNIDNNESSTLSMAINVLQAGNVGFHYKVSCENGENNDKDYLAFLIDGVELGRWDGVVQWTGTSLPLTAGLHTLEWSYRKNDSYDSGSDCAWIDNVTLPPFAGQHAASFMSDSNTLSFGAVSVGGSRTLSLGLYNLGESSMSGQFTVPAGFTVTQSLRAGEEQVRRADAGSRTDFPYTIAATEFGMFDITFTPTTEQNYSGDLLISSNDPLHQMNVIDLVAWSGTGVDDGNTPAFTDRLAGNSPNPFNPDTVINYSAAHDGTRVVLDIYNLRGQKVTTLLDSKVGAGAHSVVWKGLDSQQRPVGSGVYLCRAQIGNKVFSRRMMLVK